MDEQTERALRLLYGLREQERIERTEKQLAAIREQMSQLHADARMTRTEITKLVQGAGPHDVIMAMRIREERCVWCSWAALRTYPLNEDILRFHILVGSQAE